LKAWSSYLLVYNEWRIRVSDKTFRLQGYRRHFWSLVRTLQAVHLSLYVL